MNIKVSNARIVTLPNGLRALVTTKTLAALLRLADALPNDIKHYSEIKQISEHHAVLILRTDIYGSVKFNINANDKFLINCDTDEQYISTKGIEITEPVYSFNKPGFLFGKKFYNAETATEYLLQNLKPNTIALQKVTGLTGFFQSI